MKTLKVEFKFQVIWGILMLIVLGWIAVEIHYKNAIVNDGIRIQDVNMSGISVQGHTAETGN